MSGDPVFCFSFRSLVTVRPLAISNEDSSQITKQSAVVSSRTGVIINCRMREEFTISGYMNDDNISGFSSP